MKTKREIFNSLVSKENTETISRNKERIRNRGRLRESQQIALKVLTKLDELNWTQRRLAKEMDVTPQQISKIVKGTENLTLVTQINLQEVLDIPILATYFEKKPEMLYTAIKFEEFDNHFLPIEPIEEEFTDSKNIFRMSFDKQTSEYEYSQAAS